MRQLARKRVPRKRRARRKSETVFVQFARELTNTFPGLDLRFTMQSGSPYVRYQVADLSPESYELALAIDGAQEMIFDAVFQIKQLTRRYDA